MYLINWHMLRLFSYSLSPGSFGVAEHDYVILSDFAIYFALFLFAKCGVFCFKKFMFYLFFRDICGNFKFLQLVKINFKFVFAGSIFLAIK